MPGCVLGGRERRGAGHAGRWTVRERGDGFLTKNYLAIHLELSLGGLNERQKMRMISKKRVCDISCDVGLASDCPF